jgi:hypothetical protein
MPTKPSSSGRDLRSSWRRTQHLTDGRWRFFTPLDSVRDLDVTLDPQLTIMQHVNIVTPSCVYHLRQHWLPVAQRIEYMVDLMTFDCVRGTCPVYFRDICQPMPTVTGRSNLRSADSGDLVVPRTTRMRCIRTSQFFCSHRLEPPIGLPMHFHCKDISRGLFTRGLTTCRSVLPRL